MRDPYGLSFPVRGCGVPRDRAVRRVGTPPSRIETVRDVVEGQPTTPGFRARNVVYTLDRKGTHEPFTGTEASKGKSSSMDPTRPLGQQILPKRQTAHPSESRDSSRIQGALQVPINTVGLGDSGRTGGSLTGVGPHSTGVSVGRVASGREVTKDNDDDLSHPDRGSSLQTAGV